MPKNLILLKTFNLEFWYIEVWVTDEISKQLETGDKINRTLVVNCCLTYNMRCSVKPGDWTFVKNRGIASFAENTEKDIGKNISENLSGKCCHKLLDYTKSSAADALQTALKIAVQEIYEATGNLIRVKIYN